MTAHKSWKPGTHFPTCRQCKRLENLFRQLKWSEPLLGSWECISSLRMYLPIHCRLYVSFGRGESNESAEFQGFFWSFWVVDFLDLMGFPWKMGYFTSLESIPCLNKLQSKTDVLPLDKMATQWRLLHALPRNSFWGQAPPSIWLVLNWLGLWAQCLIPVLTLRCIGLLAFTLTTISSGFTVIRAIFVTFKSSLCTPKVNTHVRVLGKVRFC